MKESIHAHSDYTENVLPKLKHAYLKKCQDVESRTSHFFSHTAVRSHLINLQDHKSAALSAASQAKSDLHHPDSQGQYYRDPATQPVVTSPQPLRPLERRASASATTTRPRSPPLNPLGYCLPRLASSHSFSIIAQHVLSLRLNREKTVQAGYHVGVR